jgi:hypothetical protein
VKTGPFAIQHDGSDQVVFIRVLEKTPAYE